jgi:hypothetical protein
MLVDLEKIIRLGASTIGAHNASCEAHGSYKLYTLADSYNAFRRLVLVTFPEIHEAVPPPVEVRWPRRFGMMPEVSDYEILDRFEYLLALLIDFASEPESFQYIKSTLTRSNPK